VGRMIAKRFKVVQGYNDRYCQDTATNKLLNQNQTVEYLNNLCEENEQLKEEIKSLTSTLEEDYILFKRNKNAKPTKYCNQCWNYETETEEVSAFGDYQTLTKNICREGHHILDNTDATDCPDYDSKI